MSGKSLVMMGLTGLQACVKLVRYGTLPELARTAVMHAAADASLCHTHICASDRAQACGLVLICLLMAFAKFSGLSICCFISSLSSNWHAAPGHC